MVVKKMGLASNHFAIMRGAKTHHEKSILRYSGGQLFRVANFEVYGGLKIVQNANICQHSG